LKPAWEPIIVAMKPRDGTFANNALAWGVAGLWVDGGRVPTNGESTERQNYASIGYGGSDVPFNSGHPSGRWPANLILDEEAAAMLDEQSRTLTSGRAPETGFVRNTDKHRHAYAYFEGNREEPTALYGDSGGASRFFYCAKASRAERNAGCEGMEEKAQGCYGEFAGDGRGRQTEHTPTTNHHPTVKPLALMRYLVRLTRTPTGGTVLDPFMGSGTTGCACVLEDRDFVGIEVDPDYAEIARRRIEATRPEPEQAALWTR